MSENSYNSKYIITKPKKDLVWVTSAYLAQEPELLTWNTPKISKLHQIIGAE